MGHFGAPQKGTVCTLDGKNAFMVKYYCVKAFSIIHEKSLFINFYRSGRRGSLI